MLVTHEETLPLSYRQADHVLVRINEIKIYNYAHGACKFRFYVPLISVFNIDIMLFYFYGSITKIDEGITLKYCFRPTYPILFLFFASLITMIIAAIGLFAGRFLLLFYGSLLLNLLLFYLLTHKGKQEKAKLEKRFYQARGL